MNSLPSSYFRLIYHQIFSLLVSLILLFILASCVSDKDLNELKERINTLENTQIASIENQIISISSSIDDMKKTDASLEDYIKNLQDSKDVLEKELSSVKQQIEIAREELKEEVNTAKLETLESLESLKVELEEKLSLINNSISSLQNKDVELEEKIKQLESYVEDSLKSTREWSKATFATLEQYNVIAETIAGIKVDIETINKSLNQLELKLTDEIEKGIKDALATLRKELGEESTNLVQQINSLETSLKSWVNEQLSNYYTIAEINAKFNALQTQYVEADDNLKKDIQNTIDELRQQKIDITEAYKKAISTAIEEYNGHINETVQKELDSINDRINGIVDVVNAKFETIESRLKGLENQVSQILSMIQSIIVIPTYSDGSVGIKKDISCVSTKSCGRLL